MKHILTSLRHIHALHLRTAFHIYLNAEIANGILPNSFYATILPQLQEGKILSHFCTILLVNKMSCNVLYLKHIAACHFSIASEQPIFWFMCL